MKIFSKIADFFARWGAFLYMRLGIMRFWSVVHAWIWERNKQAELRRFIGIGELVSYIRTLKWTADTWRELWDAVSSIGHIQWRADNEPKRLIGDCDEFGRYSACVIENELADNVKWGTGDILRAFLFTVMWKKTGGQEWDGNKKGYGGHNVCLILYEDGTWAFMDYGMPSQRRDSIEEVAKDVRDLYAQEYAGLGWAVFDPWDLGLIEISRK